MKYPLSFTLGLLIFGAIALPAVPAQAQTTAPGPYYATPSWDQTIACTTTANCPRFIVLSNMSSAAVLDRQTGLVWEKSPSTSEFAWFGGAPTVNRASGHCNNVNVGNRLAGNRLGWRLPTIQELASLVDPSVAFPGPTLPSGHPFSNVQSDFYWSATSAAATPFLLSGDAWFVDFRFGTLGTGIKTRAILVWCVRGGQGVDPQ